jgi:hypothetical protein
MWNARVRFEPVEILGLLRLVAQEAEWSLDTGEPISWVAQPYSLIPHELLVYESYRLMHTLVSKSSSSRWPNAVEEALLFGLCKVVLTEGREGVHATAIRQTVNAFRRRVGLPPVRSLKHQSKDGWEIDVLDQLLFTDRDWQMARAEMILQPDFRDLLRIREDYFDIRFRHLTPEEMQAAQTVFQDLLARAAAGKSANGLAGIPPLHRS